MKYRWASDVIIVGVILALALACSLGLAALGEPQSQWLWCDQLNVITCETAL